MRKGLALGAVGFLLTLGTACGARPQAQGRYIYYPGATDTPATSADTAPGDTLPADTSDDVHPATSGPKSGWEPALDIEVSPRRVWGM